MFCEKCGRPVENGQTLCGKCIAKQAEAARQQVLQQVMPVQQAPVQETPAYTMPVQETPVYAMPVQQEPMVQEEGLTEVLSPADDIFHLNTPQQAAANPAPAPVRAKKKGGLIAAIVAIFAVVLCAVGVFLNMDAIKGFAGRTLKSPEAYFVDVESAAIASHSENLIAKYDKLVNKSNEKLSAGEAELRLTLGDTLISLLETAVQQEGEMALELDWLRQIKLSLAANLQTDVAQIDVGIGLGDQNLVSADAILDVKGHKVYAIVPEVNSDYVSADLSAFIPADELSKLIADSDEIRAELIKVLPSEEVLHKLIDSYVQTVLSGIKNVEKQTETVTVNSVSQKMVVLKVTVTESEAIDIVKAVLTKAQSDQELEKVIRDLGDFINKVAGKNQENYQPVDLYQEFSDGITSALEELSAAKETADSSNYMELMAYVDMKNNVRGHKLAVYEEGQQQMDPISWMTVVDGDKTYLQADLGEADIAGEKTTVKDASSGFYVLTVDGGKIGTLEFNGVTENGGTLRLIPGEEMMSKLMDGSALPSALLADNASLELTYVTGEKGKSSVELKVFLGEKELVGLAVDAKTTTGGSITVPTEARDMLNEQELAAWLKESNFDGVLDAMAKANVPGEIVDTLRGLVAMLQSNMI